MKRRYTFDEVYRYAQEVRDTEKDFWNAIRRHDVEAKNQYQTQLHTMREVLLRMHESLDKYGPLRLRFFARMFNSQNTDVKDERIEVDLSAVPYPRPPIIESELRDEQYK